MISALYNLARGNCSVEAAVNDHMATWKKMTDGEIAHYQNELKGKERGVHGKNLLVVMANNPASKDV